MKYLLLLAEVSTGKVLLHDEETIFQYQNESEINYPYIFINNIEEAELEAYKIVENNPNVEVGLFTENEEWIKTIRGNYIPPIIVKDKWWKFW